MAVGEGRVGGGESAKSRHFIAAIAWISLETGKGGSGCRREEGEDDEDDIGVDEGSNGDEEPEEDKELDETEVPSWRILLLPSLVSGWMISATAVGVGSIDGGMDEWAAEVEAEGAGSDCELM